MFKQSLILTVLLAVMIGVVAGCSSDVSTEPKDIDPTLDACPVCRMSIIDQRFAGQVIDSMGYAESFDDVGCLVLHLKRLGGEKQQQLLAVYVKDFATTQWVPAKEAFYVQGRIDTPMSFGIVAFSSREDAESMAEKISGNILTWEEVLTVNFDIGFETERQVRQEVPEPDK